MVSAIRELKEELGIEADVQFVTNKNYAYQAWDPTVTRDADLWIYKARHNGPFNPDPNEVEEARFFKLKEIEDMFASKTKFHPEFASAWEEGVIARAAAL